MHCFGLGFISPTSEPGHQLLVGGLHVLGSTKSNSAIHGCQAQLLCLAAANRLLLGTELCLP